MANITPVASDPVTFACGATMKNRFMLAPLASGVALPEDLTSAFAYTVRTHMDAMPGTVRAQEVGGAMDRVCCPLTRGFSMDFAHAGADGASSAPSP